MLIVRTPLRISLAGGGTDFPDFYQQHGGAVVSTAIDRYVWVIVNPRFDSAIYVGCSNREVVDHVDDLKHDLVREAMRKTGVTSGVEIAIMSDVPATGTGLGSSSALTIGLLHALYLHQGITPSTRQLAEEACAIELGVLKKPIGIQDQYIAAFGGLRLFRFDPDHVVREEPLSISKKRKTALAQNLLLFHTGSGRKADDILGKQQANIPERTEQLLELRSGALRMRQILENGALSDVGPLLHESWLVKKRLADGISDPMIDQMMVRALNAGAFGGKVCGAGGGGFLLLYVPPEHQERVRQAMAEMELKELEFGLEPGGSKVVFNG